MPQEPDMLRVLVVAQTPPPFGGAPIMVERFLRADYEDVQLTHVQMSFSSEKLKHEGRFRVWKIASLLALVARIIHRRFATGAQILYFTPGGPNRVSMFRDIVVLISTRWLFDKTVLHYHLGGVSELYDHLPAWQRWLFRRAYFGADAAVLISDLNPQDGKLLEAKREFVIPNGIDDPCPGLVVSQKQAGASASDPLRILFVAILRESKGVMVLVEAVGKLAARGVPFQLEIMGQWQSEEFADRVHRRIEELNLGSQIRFLGVQIGEEKFTAFRRADVFCFPSFFSCETFGVVNIEAMACGLPIVSTRWRGIPSVVDEGKVGFLVEPHDPAAVADRLEVLANDPKLRKQLGQAGRAKFEREYTFPCHADRMRRMLLETAGLAAESEMDVVPAAVAVS
jgi:glycosyltransferase involved in cell wall biosynthesis